MPSSTLLQLAARGRQDVYLTGSPQFTFYKHVYRRYTPFAIESIPIEFDGTADFGRRISLIIPRKADLLSAMFLEVDLPALPVTNPQRYWVNDIGHALIEDISIEIGDKEIDKHTGEWLQIWSSLTMTAEKREGFNEMIGHFNVYPPLSSSPQKLTIPLRFWFCNTIGAALPLIALQAHPIRIIIHLRRFQELWWSTEIQTVVCPQIDPVSIARIQLFGDYIFLDSDERKRFAANEHEYLITQLQYTPALSIPAGVHRMNVMLPFNHCCKEFIWVFQQERMRQGHEWFNFSNRLTAGGGEPFDASDIMKSAILKLDGYDRFYERGAPYFRITQPYQYHTAIPNDFIYLYSFSLRPEEEQPSGSINCSKIDDIVLHVTLQGESCDDVNLIINPSTASYDRTVVVYAPNYNVLRIVGGLGGIAFIA
jgi:hypothetical protein